jgi:hypothetical protein
MVCIVLKPVRVAVRARDLFAMHYVFNTPQPPAVVIVHVLCVWVLRVVSKHAWPSQACTIFALPIIITQTVGCSVTPAISHIQCVSAQLLTPVFDDDLPWHKHWLRPRLPSKQALASPRDCRRPDFQVLSQVQVLPAVGCPNASAAVAACAAVC